MYLHSPAVRPPSDAGAAAARAGWRRYLSALSEHRWCVWLLAAIAFADSSFLPVPPDLLLIPMGLMRPERLRWLTFVCIAGSSLGAVVGYLIGYGLWNLIGARLVEFYGYMDQFTAYRHLVEHWGFWIIILKAFTPIPFKIAAIAAGLAEMNPATFVLAAVVGRTLHFVMVALLLLLFGAKITALIERYERPLAVASVIVLIGLGVAYYLS